MGTSNILTNMCALFLSLVVFLQYNTGVLAIDNVYMDQQCSKEVSMISRGVHQGRLVFSTRKAYPKQYTSETTPDCDMSVDSWFTVPHLMFYFEYFNLDCDNGYLTFYDGTKESTPIPGINETLCGKQMPPDVYTTVKRDLRVKYTAKRQSEQKDVFKLIYTSFRLDTCPMYDIECTNGRCIVNEVACNGFNSCGDWSSCQISTTVIVFIVLGIVALFIFAGCIYCCRHCPEEEEIIYSEDPNKKPAAVVVESDGKEGKETPGSPKPLEKSETMPQAPTQK